MMGRYSAKILFTVLLGLASVSISQAQGPAPPPAPNEVPLDGLSALLIAAGVGYGAKRLRAKRKP